MLFSIITITYNYLEGLKRTAESVKNQTYTDYEWIIIDGSSQDGTVEYLDTLDAVIISEPDHGIYDAMNKGLAKAIGEYVLFLNAGDSFYSSETLENLKKVVKASIEQIDFLYGDAYEQGDNGTKHLKPARSIEKYKKAMITHHQAMLYRRATLSGIAYDTHYKIAGDYKFTCEFIQRSKVIHYTQSPICCFEVGGISQRKTSLARKEQYMIRREMGLTSFSKSVMIYYMQVCALVLRRICPSFYWFLRENKRAK